MKFIGHFRKIFSINFEDDGCVEVGKFGCLEITPYEENGEMAPVVWFSAHYQNGNNVVYNSKYVHAVVYKGVSK